MSAPKGYPNLTMAGKGPNAGKGGPSLSEGGGPTPIARFACPDELKIQLEEEGERVGDRSFARTIRRLLRERLEAIRIAPDHQAPPTPPQCRVKTRDAIRGAIRAGCTERVDIIAHTERPPSTVDPMLSRMVRDGELVRSRWGAYALPEEGS